ncbi:hypothetical protein DS891_14620 [Pseudoalteromonas sp. JC28]|uniref:hypothetical protein n=1 Tax=Pseudoalteromonas TaxID=53246 RepID=UPI00029AD74E|nr:MULTISPECIES: hypothetical protein [Pseudoalteromonas]MCF2828717.1 hypothetical protein [Pseudoalteromonas sp. OF5H-5]MCF2830792.1 hypothetical protein [Pseudoalteromonas sp. DL2-H6]MCF2925111.1 hypothetical protein [Pseudoalteromonas sp. DL2-H1]MCG7554264.1 hypothetical protein [Pseudoalteromonas sp. Of11M-6]NSY34775.1 hypothetical protein [Pseudoalteromonas sp. JC28]
MRELKKNEVILVDGAVSVSGLWEAGIKGAIGGAGFGATVGFTLGTASTGIGGAPAGAVLGLMGGGIGFISGTVSYALMQ